MKRRLLTWLAHQLWPYLQDIEAVEAEMRRRSVAAQAVALGRIDAIKVQSGPISSVTTGTLSGVGGRVEIDSRPVRRFIGQK